MNQSSWPRDSAGIPIAPPHLSEISKVRWQAITFLYEHDFGHEFDDAELFFLQMAFECFDEYREAQDWDEKIRRANEYRRLLRQLGLPEEGADGDLENSDLTEWDFLEEEDDDDEWRSHS